MLEVSKLSGWLNAFASCYEAERGAPARRRKGHGAGAVQAACTRMARQKAGAEGTGGAHKEHGVHVRDLGRVEAQRLVERRRVLPSRKEGMRCGVKCGPGERAWGGGGASGMHGGRARLKAAGQGTRGAHPEHAVHGRDLGRVESQRLVERRRVLPSRKEGMRCGAKCGPADGRGRPGHARSARRTCGPCV